MFLPSPCRPHAGAPGSTHALCAPSGTRALLMLWSGAGRHCVRLVRTWKGPSGRRRVGGVPEGEVRRGGRVLLSRGPRGLLRHPDDSACWCSVWVPVRTWVCRFLFLCWLSQVSPSSRRGLNPRLLILSLACLGVFVLLSWNYVYIPLANCRARCLLWEVQFCWSGLAVCVRPPMAFGAAQHFQPPRGWCPASQGLCPAGGQGQQEVTGTGVESAQRGSPKRGACPSVEEGSEVHPAAGHRLHL